MQHLLMADWTGMEDLGQDAYLDDTLPDASTEYDESETIVVDDSLPDASTDYSFNSEDLSLPDASLDISGSSLVVPELGKGTFVQEL